VYKYNGCELYKTDYIFDFRTNNSYGGGFSSTIPYYGVSMNENILSNGLNPICVFEPPQTYSSSKKIFF
jgi:hypothetical protein